MKILVVSPPAFTRHSGATQKEIIDNIELLKKMGHEVVLYCISTGFDYEKTAVPEVSRKLGIDVRLFSPELKNYFKRLWWTLFKHPTYFDGAAYVFGQMAEDPEFVGLVDDWKPDLIMSHFCFSWPVMRFAHRRGIPCVFRSHNYEATFHLELIKPHERLYPINWLRFLAKTLEERNSVVYSDATAALPYKEMSKYRKWKKDNIFVLTLSFPYKAFRPAPFVNADKPYPLDVFYLGASYNIPFHLLGAKSLIEDIAPEVARRAPGKFRFHICGGKLPEYLRKQCDGKDVIYEDYVQDFEEFMSRMDFAAFPTWTGTTIKGKVCETLSRAFPMVIPRNCLGTYDLKDGEQVLLAETSGAFADAVLSLEDASLRKKLSEGAHRFARDHFSEEALQNVINEIFSAAEKSAASRSQKS